MCVVPGDERGAAERRYRRVDGGRRREPQTGLPRRSGGRVGRFGDCSGPRASTEVVGRDVGGDSLGRVETVGLGKYRIRQVKWGSNWLAWVNKISYLARMVPLRLTARMSGDGMSWAVDESCSVLSTDPLTWTPVKKREKMYAVVCSLALSS